MLEESFATEDLSGSSDLIDIHFIISDNLLTEAWTISKEPKPIEKRFTDRCRDGRLASPQSRRSRVSNSITWFPPESGLNENVGTQGDLQPHSLPPTEFIPSYQRPEGRKSPQEDTNEQRSANFKSAQVRNPRPRPRGRNGPMEASGTPKNSCSPSYEAPPRPHKRKRLRSFISPSSPLPSEESPSATNTSAPVPKTSRRCRAEPLSSPKCNVEQVRSPVFIKFQSNRDAGRSPETAVEYAQQSVARAHAVAQVKVLQKAYVATTVTGVSYDVCRGKSRLRAVRNLLSMAIQDRKHRRSVKRSHAQKVSPSVLGEPIIYREIDTYTPMVSQSPLRASRTAQPRVEKCTQYEDTELKDISGREGGKPSYSQLIEIKVDDKRSQNAQRCARVKAPDGEIDVENRSSSYSELQTELLPVKHSQELHRSVYWMFIPLKVVDSQDNLECKCINCPQVCTCTADCDSAQAYEAGLRT
ncbi:hypothetical protein SprV_0501932000 [Sparganum proliferum]